MDFGYYSPLFHLIAFLFVAFVVGPFFFLLFVLPAKLLLVTISFLFDRYTSEPQGAFEACEYVFKNLAQRFGGAFYKFNSRRLVCLLPQRALFLEVERNICVQLRIYKELPHKRTIWKKCLRCGEVSEDHMIGWIKCAELLPEKKEKFPLSTLNNEQRCAFCKEWLETDRASLRCFNCNAPYHLDCFQANSGCAVFGCGDQQPVATMNSARSIHDIAKSHSGWDPQR